MRAPAQNQAQQLGFISAYSGQIAGIDEQLNFAPLWAVSIGIFVLARMGQFYGHKLEGAKPSFFKDLQFLMIGPAWVISFLYKKFGINY